MKGWIVTFCVVTVGALDTQPSLLVCSDSQNNDIYRALLQVAGPSKLVHWVSVESCSAEAASLQKYGMQYEMRGARKGRDLLECLNIIICSCICSRSGVLLLADGAPVVPAAFPAPLLNLLHTHFIRLYAEFVVPPPVADFVALVRAYVRIGDLVHAVSNTLGSSHTVLFQTFSLHFLS